MVIAFASLFLGLVVGTQPLELKVADDVARVEVALDGRTALELEGPPWKAELDFGPLLLPHRLTAVAYGSTGDELGRAEQWVNMLRPPAVTNLVLDLDPAGLASNAHMTWDSIAGTRPVRVSATFDGRPIPVEDPAAFRLPAYDPTQLHFLQVETFFTENLGSTAEATFGGSYGDRTETELTGVPIQLARKRPLPSLQELDGIFVREDRPLRVVAVDEGAADVMVVADPATFDSLQALRRQPDLFRRYSLRYIGKLRGGQQVRLLSPYPRRVARTDYAMQLFDPVGPYDPEVGGILWLLLRHPPRNASQAPLRLSDAVAVAGMVAAGGSRPRAVVLLLGDGAIEDRSQNSVESVIGYLEALRVPLVVWSTESARPTPWGKPRRFASLSQVEAAADRLARELSQQRIVWVAGNHLPTEVEMGRAIPDVSLVQ